MTVHNCVCGIYPFTIFPLCLCNLSTSSVFYHVVWHVITMSNSFSELRPYMHTTLTDVWNILPSTKWIRNTSGYSSLILCRLHSWKMADYIFILYIILNTVEWGSVTLNDYIKQSMWKTTRSWQWFLDRVW